MITLSQPALKSTGAGSVSSAKTPNPALQNTCGDGKEDPAARRDRKDREVCADPTLRFHNWTHRPTEPEPQSP